MGIFARVLRDVLMAHADSDYSYLGGQSPRSDPLWYPLRRLAIAPEVISRLKEAAESNDRRATLNPDDLEYMADQLHFTEHERERLRAALLAQGVEIFLRDRLEPMNAGAAAAIADIVYTRLLERYDAVFDSVRGGSDEAGGSSDDQIALGLAFAERADAMMHAARVAHQRGALEEARFWSHIAAVAFNEAAGVLRPVEPMLADEISARNTRLP